ncbi:MAG: hypothetical protein ACRC2K_12625 [Clostridium sp.]
MNFIVKTDSNNQIKYFKEDVFSEHLKTYPNTPPINKILSTTVDINIYNTTLSKVICSTSNEGEKMPGYALHIDYSIRCNFKYLSSTSNNSIYLFSHSDMFNSCSIMLPEYINSVETEDIIFRKYFSLSYQILNIQNLLIEKDLIYSNITTLFIFNALVE